MAWLMAVGSGLFRSSTDANRMGSTPLLPYLQPRQRGKEDTSKITRQCYRSWKSEGGTVLALTCSRPRSLCRRPT